MVYSGAWGKLIHEKNQKSKISWHCPFKSVVLHVGTMLPTAQEWAASSKMYRQE